MTQAQFARVIGLRSKGYVSRLESGAEACSIKVALKIEDHSRGRLDALSLVNDEDAGLLRRFAARLAAEVRQ
jgi:transcriptional regulator with XRE-family HTH domain